MSKSKVSFILSASGVISLWLTTEDGQHLQFSIATDHPNHKEIVRKLKSKDYSDLETICQDPTREKAAARDLAKAVDNRTSGPLVGKAKLVNGVVFVNEVPVHNVVTERVIQLSKAGLPIEPVLRFLELMLQNPSSKAQEELYDFLANRNLPLTEDGCFLGYKRVREDWLDIYSGTINNSIGRIVEVPRGDVDPNRANECSRGLHVGALDYVRGYGNGGHIVVVKVNPMDCVSVPQDHNHMKLRTCKYEVLYELPDNSASGDHALTQPVYSSSGERFTNAGEFADSECESGEYWRENWNDLEESDEVEVRRLFNHWQTFTTDDLAAELKACGVTSNRQEGRDLGKTEMAMRLIALDMDLSLDTIRNVLSTPETKTEVVDSVSEEWDDSSSQDTEWSHSSSCWEASDASCW